MQLAIIILLVIACVLLAILIKLNSDKTKAQAAENEKLLEKMRTLLLENTAMDEARIDRLRSANEQSSQLLRESIDSRLDNNDRRMEEMRRTVDEKLASMQADSRRQLNEIRETVDEKLTGTLNKRLGESFSLVNERLEAVYKGLGEMQSLANGVGDLKNVLSNVKVRGTWGEIQLDNLLSQTLSPSQYTRNVRIDPKKDERADFAIILPGQGDKDEHVLLPIDSKCPIEDYQRIIAASEKGDAMEIEVASIALENAVKKQAESIAKKYILPPYSTDFAVMYLPIEGLYAEVLRRNGLCELLQNKYRVVLAGPTTLTALLNSLQVGFKTLAIEKRSGEIWTLLGAVKTEFGKFAVTLEKTQKILQQAVGSIESAGVRTRAIERKLRSVEEIEPETAKNLLGADDWDKE